MKTKLTLSLPEATIRQAKKLAEARKTTVSALFASSIRDWAAVSLEGGVDKSKTSPRMRQVLGALKKTTSFDTKSAHIRAKHG